jgi:hypothetical protein
VKLVTVLFFDIGVYLIVVGLVLALLTVLGAYSRDPDELSLNGQGGGSPADRTGQ